MNILIISYGKIAFDGRLKEIYSVAKNIGSTKLICIGNVTDDENVITLSDEGKEYLGMRLYFNYFKKILSVLKQKRDFDIFIIDNYLVSPLGILLKIFFWNKLFIQDVRELYFIKDMSSIKGKALVLAEVILLKLVDIVMVANEQRAEIMMKKYKIKRKPLVFENLRILPNKNGNYDEGFLETISNYKVKIVSTGGFSTHRRADKLIASMSKLPSNYGLIIIGDGNETDRNIANEIIRNNDLKNVHLLGKVPLNELASYISLCDIGVVNYHRKDLNNEYCASGKVYEYLDCGLPIVTTENPPLKEFCQKYRVGVSDDEFTIGIKDVGENLDYYKLNVDSFRASIDVAKYDKKIAMEIKSLIKGMGTI